MSTELSRTDVPVPRARPPRNTMVFPRELREAIPDLPTYVGRVLELDSMSARPTNTDRYGPRVHLSLVVKETGKLKGEFTVRVDMEVESARALAATLNQLAEEAEKLETPEVVTADFVYYRLRKPDFSDDDMQRMVTAANDLRSQGKDVYVFFKHEDTPDGALNAEKLLTSQNRE